MSRHHWDTPLTNIFTHTSFQTSFSHFRPNLHLSRSHFLHLTLFLNVYQWLSLFVYLKCLSPITVIIITVFYLLRFSVCLSSLFLSISSIFPSIYFVCLSFQLVEMFPFRIMRVPQTFRKISTNLP